MHVHMHKCMQDYFYTVDTCVTGSYVILFTRPQSTTNTQSSMVMEVSAMFVAKITCWCQWVGK